MAYGLGAGLDWKMQVNTTVCWKPLRVLGPNLKTEQFKELDNQQEIYDKGSSETST